MDDVFAAVMRESEEALRVAADHALAGSKEDAQLAVQALLAHIHATLKVIKVVARPHLLPVQFHGTTLRYPEECQAGHQISEEHIARLLGQTDNPSAQQWAKELQHQRETLEPKFLGDGIWQSSQNCSDQGLAIFNHDDFDQYTWGNEWLSSSC